MNEWISVGKELPATGRRVIFTWWNDYTPPKRRSSMGFYAAKHTLYADHWEDVYIADYSEELDGYFCPEGWQEEMWEAEYHLPVAKVTHWMSLPAPPEGKE